MLKKKLCYVLPEYDANAHTHFAYISEFLKEVSKELDIFLIVEKGRVPPKDWGYTRAISADGFLRIVRVKWHLLRARMRGYKDFYVHYSFRAAFFASLITRLFGGRVFYWNCGLPWKYKRNSIRTTFELLTYKLINYLVTGTEGMARLYSAHYQIPMSKIKVMPNWISVKNAKFQMPNSKTKKDGKTVLFVHRLSKRKGAHFIPEIVKAFKDENVEFLIVGDGPDREAVEGRVNREEGKAKFLGWQPHGEIEKYFAIADAFMMPSEEEGFPHVILESLTAGVPYVAFDVGGVKEITPPEMQGFVVPLGDVDQFAQKLRTILSFDEAKRAALSAIAQQWVQQYDTKKVVRHFIEKILAN